MLYLVDCTKTGYTIHQTFASHIQLDYGKCFVSSGSHSTCLHCSVCYFKALRVGVMFSTDRSPCVHLPSTVYVLSFTCSAVKNDDEIFNELVVMYL